MSENEIAKIVVDAAYKVHINLGPGLLESVYEKVLAYEITKRGIACTTQVPIAIQYEELFLEDAFRADILVLNKVVVELKSVEKVQPVHSKQLLTYLRLMDLRLGLLVNFGEALIKNGVSRVVNRL